LQKKVDFSTTTTNRRKSEKEAKARKSKAEKMPNSGEKFNNIKTNFKQAKAKAEKSQSQSRKRLKAGIKNGNFWHLMGKE
jgi:multidrug resistance efflux pump